MIIVNDGVKLEVDSPDLIRRIMAMVLANLTGSYLPDVKTGVKRKAWSQSDIDFVISKNKEGWTPSRIAQSIGRTSGAISTLLWSLRKDGNKEVKKIKLT